MPPRSGEIPFTQVEELAIEELSQEEIREGVQMAIRSAIVFGATEQSAHEKAAAAGVLDPAWVKKQPYVKRQLNLQLKTELKNLRE